MPIDPNQTDASQSAGDIDPSNPPSDQQQDQLQQSAPAPASAPQPVTNTPSQNQPVNGSQQQQPAMVSNAPSPAPVDPAIAHAGRFYQFAQALSGGPRYSVSIDPKTGDTVRTVIPVSRGDLGMAIAMEAISGALSGLSQTGPGAVGKAAAAGFESNFARDQAARQQAEAQAQQDAQQKSDATVRAANIADINSRTLLSTAEAEGRGADTLAKIADQNRPLIDSYDEQGNVLGRNVTQDELLAGMQSGKYSSTAQIGPIDGYRLIGGGKVEATHAVIADPTSKVQLTPGMWQDYSDAHVQGFPKNQNIGADGIMVPGTVIARANEQKTMFNLAQQRHDEVSKALSESDDPKVQALAAQVPSIGSLLDSPKTGAGLATALSRYQSYVSHADISHGGRDLYESLQAIAQPSRPDPNNKGQFIPNRDAPFANTVAQAFGGWDVLDAYHNEVKPDQIDNENQAADMLASSEPGSRDYKYAQRWIQANTQQKAVIAGATAGASTSARNAADARAGFGPGSGGRSVSASGVPGTGPQDVQQAAAAIANGTGTFEQLTSGMGKDASAFRRQVESVLLKTYPNVNVAALKAYGTAASNAGVQSQLTNARSLFGTNGQSGSFDALEDAIRAVPKASIPLLSQLGQKTAYNLGSPQMATLKAIKTDIASDLAKFNTGGGSHSSDHQIELYREQLNEAQTPEQVESVLKDIRAISSKRLSGIVGPNPYLQNMTKDINDPVTKAPSGQSAQQGGQSQRPNGAPMPARIVPSGATPGRDKTGAIIGYRTSTGQIVRF